MSVLGLILFLSFFLQVAGGIAGNHSLNAFGSQKGGFSVEIDGQDVFVTAPGGISLGGAPSMPNFGLPMTGFVMMIAGQFIANIGKSGLAGSGVILDPEKAREDLKPFNQAKGQMLNDTLGEIDAVKSFTAPNQPLIQVRCTHCRSLNDETAKFCDQCGQPV